MSGLPDSYFDYPWRRRGLDHDRFPHRNLPQAKPVEWPGKARVALWIAVGEHPVPADEKSGLHFCFDAPSRKSVAAFHAGALGAGGHDNGKPGLRPDYGGNYYAAFVIDPDGYRLEAYCGAVE